MGESLPPNSHITASCSISRSGVYKNGQPLFPAQDLKTDDLLEAVYQFVNPAYPRFYKMDNLSKLGFLAAEFLLRNESGVAAYSAEDRGIILANASASLDNDLKYYQTVKAIASPALFVYTLPNIVIGEIAIRHQFKGENAFFISEDFDAGFIADYVNNLINNNTLRCCICGWLELFKEEFRALLMLVERPANNSNGGLLLEKKNIFSIYQQAHG